MKIKIGISLIIFLLIFLFISGCFEEENNSVLSDEEKFIGTWVNYSQYQGNTVISTYNFFENKSYMLNINNKLSFWGSWNISNKKIVTEIGGKIQNSTYIFLDNNLKLKLIDDTGFTTVLTKR